MTTPVTVAPASDAAFLTPLVTPSGAPGSVTRTSLCPASRRPLPSSSDSDACRKESAALACAWAASRSVLVAASWLLSELDVDLSTLRAPPCNSVDPKTMPIASARNTATMETR